MSSWTILTSVGVFEVDQVLPLEVWISSVQDEETFSVKKKEVDGSLPPKVLRF